MIAHEMPGDHRSDLDRASEPASAGTSSPNHPGKAGGDGVMVQQIGGCVSVTEGATWIGSVTSAFILSKSAFDPPGTINLGG